MHPFRGRCVIPKTGLRYNLINITIWFYVYSYINIPIFKILSVLYKIYPKMGVRYTHSDFTNQFLGFQNILIPNFIKIFPWTPEILNNYYIPERDLIKSHWPLASDLLLKTRSLFDIPPGLMFYFYTLFNKKWTNKDIFMKFGILMF